MTAWLNGHLLDPYAACISPADRGFLLGDGIFETIRATAGRPHHLAHHLARLRRGAATLAIPVPFPDEALAAAIAQVASGIAQAAVRVTLSRGPGGRGVSPPPDARPTLLITAAPAPPPGGPLHAVIATNTRRNEHSPLSRIKSLNYLDSILARAEAARAGAGEAILLNTAGRVAEAAAGNLFVLHAGAWRTPPVAEGALPGIARLLLLAAGLAAEATLAADTLLAADAAFVSSSLGLRPIGRLGGRQLALPDLAEFQFILDDGGPD